MTVERKGRVTFKGAPLTLRGREMVVGTPVPDIQLLNANLETVRLKDFRGKVCVVLSVPSLDTPTCDVETRKFNEYAGTMGAGVVVLAVSMDLPFAQKRWCGSANVERVVTLSDFRDREFGKNFGVLIEELGLLARAVFVVDPEGILRYRQLVTEIGDEPNYDEVRQAVAALV